MNPSYFYRISKCKKKDGCVVSRHKKRAGIKIQPRFKIQYPMKNRDETKLWILQLQFYIEYFYTYFLKTLLVFRCVLFNSANRYSALLLANL